MSDEWGVYLLRVDGEPASICLDMGISRSAPLKGFDQRAYIRVEMLHPREDGLSSEAEFEDLCELEEAVTTAIETTTKSVYVGRNTSGGNRDLYFYTADGNAFEAAAKAATVAFPAYSFEIGRRSDPTWRDYFEFLYPSPISRQQMANRSVIENLVKHGDRKDQPRRIDHMVAFTNSAKCEAFSKFLLQHGFIVNEGSPTPFDGEFHLEFYKIGKPDEIDDITGQLFKTAIEHDGEYDGWGCEVIT
jgi:uncharacterized protein (TIGR01619 family)